MPGMSGDPIPGMEIPDPPASPIVAGVERTLATLTELELLSDVHAAQVELVRLVARKLSAIAERGQAYGVAMLVRELREALGALPAVPEGDDRDDWNDLESALRGSTMGDGPVA
jgi:hypothetical protein